MTAAHDGPVDLQAKRTLQSTIFSLESDRSRLERRREEVLAAIHRFQRIINEHQQFIAGEEEHIKKIDIDLTEITTELQRAKKKLQNL